MGKWKELFIHSYRLMPLFSLSVVGDCMKFTTRRGGTHRVDTTAGMDESNVARVRERRAHISDGDSDA
jgi:hypothetical protein